MGRWKEPGLEKMKVWESRWAKLEMESKLEIGLGFELGGAWETVKELLRDEWMGEKKEKKLAILKEENSEQMTETKSEVSWGAKKETHLVYWKGGK
jgi:hypothetical protein